MGTCLAGVLRRSRRVRTLLVILGSPLRATTRSAEFPRVQRDVQTVVEKWVRAMRAHRSFSPPTPTSIRITREVLVVKRFRRMGQAPPEVGASPLRIGFEVDRRRPSFLLVPRCFQSDCREA